MKKILMLTTATAALVSAPPIQAQGRESNGREFAYFLPRARAIVRVDQLIRRCPTGAGAPLIMSTASIADRAGPDAGAMIRVDASSGFLSGRTTRLVLQPDGTLTSFNAATTGEGGQVLSSLIGVATTVASLAVGMPPVAGAFGPRGADVTPAPPPDFRCTDEVQRLVDRMARVEEDLDALRSSVAQGNEPASAATVMEALSSELSGLVDRLTLSTEHHVFNPEAADFATRAEDQGSRRSELVEVLSPIDYTYWFGTNSEALRTWLHNLSVPGRFGFRAALTPNQALLGALSAGDGSVTGNVNPTPPGSPPTPYLIYRRPVPATVSVVPCGSPAVGGDCAPADDRAALAASAERSVRFPQLSGLFSIRIGRGSIFGTRRAAAEFDAYGAPTILEYGSSPGGAEIAGVIDATGTAITTLRDAPTAAINRRLEREKALSELNALLEASRP